MQTSNRHILRIYVASQATFEEEFILSFAKGSFCSCFTILLTFFFSNLFILIFTFKQAQYIKKLFFWKSYITVKFK